MIIRLELFKPNVNKINVKSITKYDEFMVEHMYIIYTKKKLNY